MSTRRLPINPKYGTEADLEIALLKHKVDDLTAENLHLREFCLEQHKEMKQLKTRNGWDQFFDCFQRIGEHRVNDAIELLESLRKAHQREQAVGPSADSDNRRSYVLNSATVPDFKYHEQTIRRVDSVAALAHKVTSAFKWNKKSKSIKDKGKFREVDIAEVGDYYGQNRAFAIIAEWEEQQRSHEEYEKRLAEERELRHRREPKINGEHEQLVRGWRLEKAQEEYRSSAEKTKEKADDGEKPNLPERNPRRPRKHMKGQGGSRRGPRVTNGVLVVAGTKREATATDDVRDAPNPERKPTDENYETKNKSKHIEEAEELDEELLAAMEKEVLGRHPSNSTTRNYNWPEGTVMTGSIFEGSKGPIPPVPTRPPHTSHLPQPTKSKSKSKAVKKLEIEATDSELIAQFPRPARTVPAIPHRSHPRPVEVPPPAPPSVRTDADDVFAFARPVRALGAPFPATDQPMRKLRHRASLPSPTPRFVSHRPTSPSPGGNEPMPETPMPGWLKPAKSMKSISSVDGGR